MTTKEFENFVHEALDNYGATLPNWRIRILSRDHYGNNEKNIDGD